MRAEIAQAKREVNFYTRGAEKQKRMKRRKDVEDETNSGTLNTEIQREPINRPSEEESTNEKAVSIMKSILI